MPSRGLLQRPASRLALRDALWRALLRVRREGIEIDLMLRSERERASRSTRSIIYNTLPRSRPVGLIASITPRTAKASADLYFAGKNMTEDSSAMPVLLPTSTAPPI